MAEARIFFYSIAGLFVGVFLFVMGFIWLRQKRLIENIPTSKVRSIAMGLVEIFGEAVPAKKKVLKSPFTNKDCVYYKYIIQEYRSSGKSGHWATIKKGNKSVNFYLKDKTGSVLVDPKDAKVDIPKDFEFNSNLGKDPPLGVKRFLKKNKLSFEGFLGINKRMRYREYFIEPKDKLYILGTAGDNPFVKEATAKNSAEDIMIQKGKIERMYYISDKPEKEVLKKLTWKIIGGIAGGVFLIIMFVIETLLYFGFL
jgi:hypothetical protein